MGQIAVVTQVEAFNEAPEKYAALDLKSVALLLDVDGTLIDIGPSPYEVNVPKELCRTLERLVALTGGALALISGRPIAGLDRLFAPLKLSAVGGHGAEIRVADAAVRHHIRPLPKAMRERIAAGVPAHVLVEDKGYSVALHYRGVPVGKERLQRLLAEVGAEYPKESVEILPGKEMLELKRAGINKGAAVQTLMTLDPFAGRMPVFIGDDVTDESVFAILPEIGGEAFSVGRKFDGLTAIFDTPASVRAALQRLAAQGVHS
jgi:trehalose 6-phosphate phosphatase